MGLLKNFLFGVIFIYGIKFMVLHHLHDPNVESPIHYYTAEEKKHPVHIPFPSEKQYPQLSYNHVR